ncbi:MAG TPA: helix-turn-helix domain-containing protein [Ensifer sp.]|jgi:transcriptional regulator GlxA family with amidase domain|uniref:GlxA family transcriptional regulator n=1 Tax=Ensifer sp. TaxID=1872086 RepID=UPI002E15C2C5|nr:helix-turn-helix domain-containing protein [Ensifer sp.]
MPSFYAKPEEKTRTVAIVLFDRTKLIDVTGPLQVFNDARMPCGQPAYAIQLLSETGGLVVTDTGVALDTLPFSHAVSAPPDTLLVSGGQSALQAASSQALLAFLADMAGTCRRLGSICLGAFILARGGHLDGRRATTHWEDCAQFRDAFPAIDVREDSIYEQDRGVWTSAGVTAGIDMALAMVEEDLGRNEALRLARSLVLYVKRTGGQRQFSAALDQQIRSSSDRFDALVTEIRANLAADLSVPRLADMARMSERNFSRLFTETMGASPAQFIEELRVDAACDALQRGDVSVAQAPFLFGFGNPERLRRAFQRRKGISPSDYEARFGPRRPEAT